MSGPALIWAWKSAISWRTTLLAAAAPQQEHGNALRRGLGARRRSLVRRVVDAIRRRTQRIE
jgi:hypothetical protein